MSKSTRITNYALGAIIGLVISIWWIFMGLDFGFKFGAGFDRISYLLTLGGHRHTIMPIVALILIPICAREHRWGFLAAMVLGIVTLSLLLIHSIYLLICSLPGFESIVFGPIVWPVIQIPIILFSYKARQELTKATIESGI